MEPSQGEIIQKPKMQELSSLSITHHINVMYALVKFSEYIPYSLGVWPRHGLLYGIKSRGNNSKTKMQELSSLFITHHLIVMYAPVKFHEYIPYSLGVMAWTPFTIWNLVKGK